MYASKLFVAAIDFGSNYTGYAFSNVNQPDCIYTFDWKHNHLVSTKVPTAVLLNAKKEFLAFGYDAETKYMQSLEHDSDEEDSGEEKDVLYYFRKFNTIFHTESVGMDFLIEDDNRRTDMKAFDIFTLTIKYLKEQIFTRLNRMCDVGTDDIHYVLTVPAIWDVQSKYFMKKAAEKAGIQWNNITIVLKPDAACMYCQELRTFEDKLKSTFIEKCMKLVVVDLGGRTADITVHERHPNGLIKEVVPPSHGDWGEAVVVDDFLRFLENVFGIQVIKELKLNDLEDYTELIHEFEVKKQLINPDTTSDTIITMPVGLVNIIKRRCGGLAAAIKKSKYGDFISVRGQQKLCVNPQKFRDLFKPTIESLLKHLDQLFKHPEVSDVHQVIMVGKFSECKIVQKATENEFPKKKIIIPKEAGLAVLKGAVLYGHRNTVGQVDAVLRWTKTEEKTATGGKTISDVMKDGFVNKNDSMDSGKLFVVAIDFGTTYSGYAFSTRSSPNDIYTCNWKEGTLVSMKTPTSVLLNNDKKFVAFGFEAENKYMHSLEMDDVESDDENSSSNQMYHYFNRFKMMLHKQTVNLDTTIKDQNGEQFKAFDIFAFAIKYLKEQAVGQLLKSLTNVKTKDIHYVLTVPAIWDDKAKIFMRKAAEKAGIQGKDLTIALEPETASIYCQELRTNRDDKTKNTFSETIKKGTKYLVLDLGGGTADITVHERLLDDSLEEVLPPSGGDWGGIAIDQAYIEFLHCVFTKKVIEELKSNDLEDYTNLCHEFEVKKRSITSALSTDIVISLPYSLVQTTAKLCKSVQAVIIKSSYKDLVSFSAPQKLIVNPEVFRKLFKPTIDALIGHLDKLLQDPNLSDLHHIIMVGGFAECELVKTAMRGKFPNRKIIIPDEAGMVVLKGAVLFGHQPKKIVKRIMKKTYGIQSWPKWNPHLYHESKRVEIDGVYRCKDVFHKFAEKGQKVEDGHSHAQIFQLLKPDECALECTVYTSDDTNPLYVTDTNCQRLGNLIVPINSIKMGRKLEIEETLIFGGTELLFRAKNMETKEIYENRFELF